MALETKKFLDYAGTTHLWQRIATELNAKGKIDSITAADNSVTIINGNTKDPQIEVKISPKAGNSLVVETTTGNEGLYVSVPTAVEYSITKDDSSSDYAAVYHLTKDGVNQGVAINIPKDMVVESGSVVTKTESGTWGAAGTYLHLILANAQHSDLYINVGDLITQVTSGSASTDPIVIAIDSNNQITATLTDGTITKAKLHNDVQTSLNKADSALQIADITSGSANGTISIKGSNIAVHGLGTAAYQDTTHFDLAGAANDVYAAIIALTTTEIDNAIAAANNT